MTAPCTQRQFGFGLIVCMSVVTVSNMSYASTAQQQRLCSSDAFRLCSSKAVFDRPEPNSSTQ